MKSTTIMLPGARVAQLRALADAESTTISDVIERLIHREIAAGRLPDTLPGFDVTSAMGRVFLTCDRFTFPAMTPAQTRQVADLFITVTDNSREGHRQGIKFSEDGNVLILGVARRGRGIVISVKDGQAGRIVKVSLTPGMARDLARIIKTEAAKAAK